MLSLDVSGREVVGAGDGWAEGRACIEDTCVPLTEIKEARQDELVLKPQ